METGDYRKRFVIPKNCLKQIGKGLWRITLSNNR